jgi:single-strand DNA-binding protein
MNILSITGNLGKDCRVGSAGNTAVCNFAVGFKSGFGDNAQTLWVDCALWGKQAESKLPEYLLKGQQVAVSGELGQREHEGKMYLTMRVSSIDLVGGKSESNQQPRQQQQSNQQQQQNRQQPQQNYQQPVRQQAPDVEYDDTIPF